MSVLLWSYMRIISALQPLLPDSQGRWATPPSKRQTVLLIVLVSCLLAIFVIAAFTQPSAFNNAFEVARQLWRSYFWVGVTIMVVAAVYGYVASKIWPVAKTLRTGFAVTVVISILPTAALLLLNIAFSFSLGQGNAGFAGLGILVVVVALVFTSIGGVLIGILILPGILLGVAIQKASKLVGRIRETREGRPTADSLGSADDQR